MTRVKARQVAAAYVLMGSTSLACALLAATLAALRQVLT